MLRPLIAPSGKPRAVPVLRRSKSPISLICALSKAREMAVLHRIKVKVEMELDGRQYVYRTSRGTETHLTEFHDFVREAQMAGLCVYIVSVGVDSAFDAAPRSLLVRTVGKRGAGSFFCIYVYGWLAKRIFSVRLSAPTGRHSSRWRAIRHGVP